MKSGHVITAGVLAAVALLVVWIARNTYWDEITVPMPMTGEARTNSLYAAQRLAEELGVTVHSQRRLDALPEPSAVIYLSHWSWNLVPSRRERLQRWVESGGRLVADLSLIGGAAELEQWAGISRKLLPIEDIETGPDARRIERATRETTAECAYLDAATAAPGTTRTRYFICGAAAGSRLDSRLEPAWALRDEDGVQVLRVARGRGSFTLLNADPFRNRTLFDGNNALLFVAATGIERGDTLYFLSEEKSRSLLALMWLHGAPVILLALGAVAFALWRGSLRFGPLAAVPDPARRSLAEQIVGTGRFTLRFGGGRALHAAAVRALHETAQRHLSGYGNMPSDTRVEALARNTGLDESSLAEAINFAGPRRAIQLRKVLVLLETARRRILEER